MALRINSRKTMQLEAVTLTTLQTFYLLLGLSEVQPAVPSDKPPLIIGVGFMRRIER